MSLQSLFPDMMFPASADAASRRTGLSRYIGTSGARVRTSSNEDSTATFVPFDDTAATATVTAIDAAGTATANTSSGSSSSSSMARRSRGQPSAEATYLLQQLHSTRPNQSTSIYGDADDTGDWAGITPFDDQPSAAYNAMLVSSTQQQQAVLAGSPRQRQSPLQSPSLGQSPKASADAADESAGRGGSGKSSAGSGKYSNNSRIVSSWERRTQTAKEEQHEAGINKHVHKYASYLSKCCRHFAVLSLIIVGFPLLIVLLTCFGYV